MARVREFAIRSEPHTARCCPRTRSIGPLRRAVCSAPSARRHPYRRPTRRRPGTERRQPLHATERLQFPREDFQKSAMSGGSARRLARMDAPLTRQPHVSPQREATLPLTSPAVHRIMDRSTIDRSTAAARPPGAIHGNECRSVTESVLAAFARARPNRGPRGQQVRLPEPGQRRPPRQRQSHLAQQGREGTPRRSWARPASWPRRGVAHPGRRSSAP